MLQAVQAVAEVQAAQSGMALEQAGREEKRVVSEAIDLYAWRQQQQATYEKNDKKEF